MGVSGAGNDTKRKEDDKLQIILLNEFILHHGELAEQPDRGLRQEDNPAFFKADFLEGRLDRYAGTYVAYQKGTLCGQSANGEKLHHEAACYYGGSGLTVYRVPEARDIQALETAIEQGKQYPSLKQNH